MYASIVVIRIIKYDRLKIYTIYIVIYSFSIHFHIVYDRLPRGQFKGPSAQLLRQLPGS